MLSVSMEQTVREKCVYCEKTVADENFPELFLIAGNTFGEYGTNTRGKCVYCDKTLP